MIPSVRPSIVVAVALAAVALAGCAGTIGGGLGTFGRSSEAAGPKTFVVSDFVFSNDVVALDRGYTARLERKIGSFPVSDRKQRTAERVNDEIVASIIATLDEAGLKAGPGSEEGLTLKDNVILITGRLRTGQGKPAKNQQIGFGAGHGDVAADMTVSQFTSGAKNPLLDFSVPAPSGRAPTLDRKQAAARNAAIEAALAAEGTPAVKLSADSEMQARRLGRAVGDKIVAVAKERGWLAKTDQSAAMPPPPATPSPSHSTRLGM